VPPKTPGLAITEHSKLPLVKAGGRVRHSAALDRTIDGEATHPVPEVLSGCRETQKSNLVLRGHRPTPDCERIAQPKRSGNAAGFGLAVDPATTEVTRLVGQWL